MTNPHNLKPCPFCGGSAIKGIRCEEYTGPSRSGRDRYFDFIRCDACNSTIDEETCNLESAINAWNTRTDPLVQELVAALEGVIRVADRATVEFDAAHKALSRARGE